tara:strand:+ start:913 stop:1146 length:234 start_codon:yes stop_codon:yes gene_type:complete
MSKQTKQPETLHEDFEISKRPGDGMFALWRKIPIDTLGMLDPAEGNIPIAKIWVILEVCSSKRKALRMQKGYVSGKY